MKFFTQKKLFRAPMQSSSKKIKINKGSENWCFIHSFLLDKCYKCQRTAATWSILACNIKIDTNLETLIGERIIEVKPAIGIFFDNVNNCFYFDYHNKNNMYIFINGTDEVYAGFVIGLFIFHNIPRTNTMINDIFDKRSGMEVIKKAAYPNIFLCTHNRFWCNIGVNNKEEFLCGLYKSTELCNYYTDPEGPENYCKRVIKLACWIVSGYDTSSNIDCKIKIIEIEH